ncbi:hypothetical protein A3D78_00995 [Candidatus Gottesmanbacteria bacterium RIFCSPHIGHO2_02_FULL_39_14]|uniref:Uncharacterized protein n=3 Tax=Candidatus Gottesmaniibacteriota TaxID=1752720 RepID=A0A1F6A159_9BACT|nr:MAG: hypothetical protein A2153_06190 [Candidatus Gottesmanbacteria bacterium RBG_16_38_7b]OGG18057.1 MAG: hypothetical protein A3D78_00995 [Candidatus Gottesmanbacteria bacterium RIFCSPHIGHO2_02_FULL_39_14]OGG32395.1 MAG: hypothetical protein A3I51_03850 [Candidatus Gottesmanbacteria bacterium RIFCSPLOWO2_02_FULL_38_8]
MIKKIPVSYYIDPGTGSFLFQILAAFILTVIVTGRRTFQFFRTLIKKVLSLKKNGHDKIS